MNLINIKMIVGRVVFKELLVLFNNSNLYAWFSYTVKSVQVLKNIKFS